MDNSRAAFSIQSKAVHASFGIVISQVIVAQSYVKRLPWTCQRGGKWDLVIRFLQLTMAFPARTLVVPNLKLTVVLKSVILGLQ